MDKQKQIEEIAKELCPHYDNGNCYYEVTEVRECCCGCEFCWAVSQVLNAGYRKLDDHAIMSLRKAKDMEERIRKETAEKFADLALKEIKAISTKSEYLLEDESVYEDSALENVLEKVKNEICKEITEGKV